MEKTTMTKIRFFKATAALICILVLTAAILAVGAVPSHASTEAPPPASEATDVYWYVHTDGKLILSSEQGNTGLTKWSKDKIALVSSAADVPWNSNRAKITEVVFYSPVAPSSTAFWFNATEITSFSASVGGTLNLDMRFVTNAERMFAACSSLTSLDLSGVSAPLVTNIESAFDGCEKIKTLDLSCFDGAPLVNIMNAFYNCKALTSLDVSGLNTAAVTDFTRVFYGCSSLTSLDLSAIDGRKNTSLNETFYGCEKLKTLTFGESFTCERVTNMSGAFRNCKALTSLDISKFSTSLVTDMSYTFTGCSSLADLKLGEGFVCSSVTSMRSTFTGCGALSSIDTSGWGAVNVKNMNSIFESCASLESLDLSGFDGAAPTDICQAFSGMSRLRSVDLSKIDTSGVTSLEELFNGCSSLEAFDLLSINTSSVTSMNSMFKGCTSLKSVSFKNVNTSSLTDMSSMMNGCSALTSVDLTGTDTALVTNVRYMLYGCHMLTELDLSDFDVAENLSSKHLVRDCRRLAKIIAPNSIPEGRSISLYDLTFYTGTEEIGELTHENESDTVVRKFEIKYSLKNGTTTTSYNLEPNYYYYGTGTAITASISSAGYTFDGWTRSGSDVLVTEITSTDIGTVTLYAKMTPFLPKAPVITESADAIVSFSDGYSVSISFTEEELHTYNIEWYRTPTSANTSGFHLTAIRNTRGFTATPYSLVHGTEIDTDTYFYCEITAKRTDNGLSVKVKSEPIKVHVSYVQAEVLTHPTAVTGLVYTGSAQAVTAGGESNHGSRTNIVYSHSPNGPFSGDNKITASGTGTIYYKAYGGLYFIDSQVYSLTYTIDAAAPTVFFENTAETFTYTGSAAAISPAKVTLLGTDTYVGTVSYTYTGTSSGTGIPTNAGTYTLTAHIEASGHYKAASSSNTLTLTINKAAPSLVTPPGAVAGLVYNAKEQSLVEGGEVLGGTLEYGLTASSLGNAVPTARNAGEYTVYYRIKGDENHTDGDVFTVNASIAKKTLTVSANDTFMCLGSALPHFTYSVTGLCEGDSLSVSPTLVTDTSVSATGEYTIIASNASAGTNYTVVHENATLTVREHSFDGGRVTETPTCDKSGTKTYTCAHDPSHTYTEPVPIDGSAHSWDSGTVTKNPTCTEKGVKTYHCIHNSNHTYTEEINALGHTEAALAEKAPTCTETGLTAGVKCSVCEAVLVAQDEIPATSCVFDNACDTDCSVCGEKREVPSHTDSDENLVCDVCGAELPKEGLSGGAIAAIVIGSVAAIGLLAFAAYIFLIKKRRQ